MQRVVLGAMVALAPFSGIRVICVASPTASVHPIAQAEPLSDCERLCPLHPPTEGPSEHSQPGHSEEGSDTGDSDCAFSTDASMGFVTASTLPTAGAVLDAPAAVTPVHVATVGFYTEPALTLLGPPPKTLAL